MEICDASVNWYEGYLNPPVLSIWVNDRPSLDELRFAHDDGLWVAKHRGYVRYFYWAGPDNEGGYGGDHYDITTVDGETVTLKGPWSSRAGYVNGTQFGPVVGVRLSPGPSYNSEESGYFGPTGAAVTLEFANRAIEYVDEDVALEPSISYGGEVCWVPTRL